MRASVKNVPNVSHGPAWAPWGGQKSSGVLAVDPGAKGGIVAGSCIPDVQVIPYPESSLEKRDFFGNLRSLGFNALGAAFYYELRPVTDKLPGGAKRVYAMGKDDGIWEVISASFVKKNGVYPAKWRRIAFPTINRKPVGSMEWKLLELKYCRFFTGERLVPANTPGSDHKIYGISAAFCIWLCGAQTEGLLDIKSEIERIKGGE